MAYVKQIGYIKTAAQRRAEAQAKAEQLRAQRQMEEQAKAAKLEAAKQNVNPLLRGISTEWRVKSKLVTGALGAVEGIVDLGIGAVGAVGGLFSEDFREGAKNVVAFDATQEWVGKHLDELTKYSYTEGNKVGEIVENVASGVGQMLPAVAVTVATGGAGAPAALANASSKLGLATTMASAAGGATQEAYNDGAEYYRGLGYGLAGGAVEGATEKLVGGVGNKLTGAGKGLLDDALKNVAKQGAARVAKEAVGEGVEEMLSEAANPALKSIYKGKEAWREYTNPEFAGRVAEAGLVGGLTSVAFGQTAGRMMSRGSQDIDASMEAISEVQKEIARSDVAEQSSEVRNRLQETVGKNYENIEKVLKKASPEERKRLIEAYELEGKFDSDGSINADFALKNGFEVKDGKVTANNTKQVAKENLRYVATALQHDPEQITADLEQINADLGEGHAPVTLYGGELTEQGATAYKDVKQAVYNLNQKTGAKLNVSIVTPNDSFNGVTVQGKNIYIAADVLENNSQATSLIQEMNQVSAKTKQGSSQSALDNIPAVQYLARESASDGTGNYEGRVQTHQDDAKQVEELLTKLKRKYHVDKSAKSEQNPSTAFGTLFHETAHVAEGSKEYGEWIQFLAKDEQLVEETIDTIIHEKPEYGFSETLATDAIQKLQTGETMTNKERSFISELNAHMSEQLLGTDEAFIERLVRSDTTLAEKALNRIGDLKRSFESFKSPEARSEYRRLHKAEQLYLKALSAAGMTYRGGKIIRREEDEENRTENSAKYSLKILYADGSLEELADARSLTNEQALNYLEQAKKGELRRDTYIPVRKDTPQVIIDTVEQVNEKISNRSLVMQVNKAQQAMAVNNPGARRATDGNNLRPHKLTPTEVLEVINQLDDPTAIIYQTNRQDKHGNNLPNNVAVFVNYNAGNNEGVAVVEFESSIDPTYIGNEVGDASYHTVVTVFEPDVERQNMEFDYLEELLSNPNNMELEIQRRQSTRSATGEKHPNASSKLPSGNSITNPNEKVNSKSQFSRKTSAVQTVTKQKETIKVGMNDEERTKILNNLKITPQNIKIAKNFDLDFTQLQNNAWKTVKKPMLAKLRELGYLKSYTAEQLDIEFEFTGEGLRKSTNSQIFEYGGSLADLSKVVMNIQELLDCAVLIEIHSDKAKGTPKENSQLLQTYVLLSALREGKTITPIQFEVKQYVDNQNRLYLAVALTKIETSVISDTILENQASTRLLPVSNISIPQLISKINPADKNFFKYIPDGFLNESQLRAKREALALEAKKYGRSLEKTVQFSRKPSAGQTVTKQKETIKQQNQRLEDQRDKLNLQRQENKQLKEKISNIEDIERAERTALYLIGKLDEMKKGAFLNASQLKDDRFRGSIERLTRLRYRGNLRRGDAIRGELKILWEWYTNEENQLFTKDNGYFNQDIALMLQGLSNGEGDMTLSELKYLNTVLDYFKHTVDSFNKVYRAGKYVDAMPLAKRYVDSIQANDRDKSGFYRQMYKYFKYFGDPAALMRYADLHDPNGFFTQIYEEFRVGAIGAAVMEKQLLQEWEDMLGAKGMADYRKHLDKDHITYMDREIPIRNAIALYMTHNRQQAWAALCRTGFSIDVDGKRIKFAALIDNQNKPTEAEMKRAVHAAKQKLYEQFSEQDRKLIQVVERTFEKCSPLKKAIDMIRFGFSNVMNGYYFPLRRANSSENVDSVQFEVDRVSHLAFNQDTVQGAAGELLIEPIDTIFRRHIHGISMYHNLAIPTDNLNRLLNLNTGKNHNNPISVLSLLNQSTFGRDMYDYLLQLKSDIEGVPKGERDTRDFNRAVGKIRGAWAKSQLGANPKVWATQFSSLFSASSILSYDSIVLGLGVRNTLKDVDQYCDLAMLRNAENSVALAQGVIEKTGKVGDVLMKPIGWTDRLVISRLFGACQIEVQKNQKLKLGTEANKKAAGELLTRVILETQQNSLATERSSAMRSSNELLKSVTMFSADAMKMTGRVIDSLGEVTVLRRKLKNGTDAERPALEKQLKVAKKRFGKSMGALVSSAVFMAIIAQIFRDWYRKDEDKEKDEIAKGVAADLFGNMLGGLPILRDIYSYFADGYEMENALYATFNDTMEAVGGLRDLAGSALEGNEISQQEINSKMRKLIYAAGQLTGLPMRNLYNHTTGWINRLSPSAGYWIDSQFYAKSYRADLAKAIENEDDKMIATIAGLITNEKIGSESDATRTAIRGLVEKGYTDLLPRSLGDTVTYDGEEIELTAAQKKRFRSIYDIADESVDTLVTLKLYGDAEDEVRAKSIKFIYDTYYYLALEDLMGVENGKRTLFAEAIDIEKLALIISTAKGITADKDRTGKVIQGSRKEKVIKYIESLRLSAAQKHMILGYLGYKNTNGEAKVRAYINTLNLSRTEKAALLEYSGYDVA